MIFALILIKYWQKNVEKLLGVTISVKNVFFYTNVRENKRVSSSFPASYRKTWHLLRGVGTAGASGACAPTDFREGSPKKSHDR